MTGLLFTEAEWDFATLDRTYKAIEEIALNDLKLDVYPNQVEIISSEQMLDAYSSLGMPLMYHHWSFGKLFAREDTMYRAGYSALAYEIVINSSPCISYLLEENTMTMQALVMAHAAFGHNHFFKNNYLFRQWTNAEGILDYLAFAKHYISACEERYGRDEVELVLDAAHALMDQGVFRYRRPPKPSRERVLEKRRRRAAYEEEAYNDLWRTLPAGIEPPAAPPTLVDEDEFDGEIKLPEENLLYFIEKNSPTLRGWQREILRIVRNMAQYFYPQRQTKVMNEGCATFVHHTIMNILYDRGLISEGSLLEFLHSHTSVVFQPEFDDRRFGGLNPYALGFAMMSDIRRIAEAPTAEDRDWFPDFAGSGDWVGALKDAWANYRDESFIEQFLSPKLIRDFRLFSLYDKADEGAYRVSAIHDEQGYRKVRSLLARQYDPGIADPNIQVVDADLKGDRTLFLEHKMYRGIPLQHATKDQVVAHIERLWGHDVVLEEVAD
ncbi:SpoVR family protein [Rhizomicrobium electricum]|uniref:SpoVR family protein n=1 Tax=Rhizomicrobium electricum TaxID=480070 RepID=A0ABP3PIY9_9PROT|nr:SpoVR family protein [Rhizomicrobium electricum]NIJ47117.1 spore cortex formation protein SpoVR/YcgB (stage V sporulation) [Rhizomicrobium electricum]